MTYMVVVNVAKVTTSTAVLVLVCTAVAVSVSVTVSVTGSRERYDEQKASPTAATAPTHLPLQGLEMHLPKPPAAKPARQSADSFMMRITNGD